MTEPCVLNRIEATSLRQAHAEADHVSRTLSPEMRARLIADEVGMGPIDERMKRVFDAALEHIRAAVAIAENRARQSSERFSRLTVGAD